MLELQTFGVYAQSGKVRWNKSRAVIVAVIMIAPLMIAAILDFTDVSRPSHGLATAYFGWLAYFFFLAILEIVMAWAGVTTFHSLTGHLESLLTQRGRDAYDRWANFATALLPQLVFAISFSALASVALWLAASVHGMASRLYIAPPSYLAIVVCGYFISQGAYWIIAGTFLSVLLTRPGHMKPIWHSPAYTPGIELLARCYRLAFYGTSLGVALCLFPLLTWVYKGPSSAQLLTVKIALFIASVAAALLIAVVPQWRLSVVVGQQRRETIEQLEALLPSEVSKVLPGSQSDAVLLAWLQLASTSPSSTVQSSTIAGMLLGLAAAVLPYIARFIT